MSHVNQLAADLLGEAIGWTAEDEAHHRRTVRASRLSKRDRSDLRRWMWALKEAQAGLTRARGVALVLPPERALSDHQRAVRQATEDDLRELPGLIDELRGAIEDVASRRRPTCTAPLRPVSARRRRAPRPRGRRSAPSRRSTSRAGPSDDDGPADPADLGAAIGVPA